MNAPWRHHSVPQFLLRNFSDAEGLLYHYDKREPADGIKHTGPRGIFFQRHQYSAIDIATGEFDPSLEHFFDREVENPAAPIVEKILAAAHEKKAPRLTPPKKSQLDLFMQYQLRRAPELVRKYVPNFHANLAIGLAQAEAELGQLPEGTKDHFTTNQAKFTQNAIVNAQGLASPAIAALQRDRGLLIAVIADPKKVFIIGSNPMVAFPAPGFREFGAYGLWLPISSHVAISNGGPTGTEDLRGITDHRGIRRLNDLSFEQSDEIAGRSRALIESLTNRR